MRNNSFIRILGILVIAVLFAVEINAQSNEVEKKSPDLNFVCKKTSDGGFELKARLSLFENRKDLAIAGELIHFKVGNDSLLSINGNKTNINGYAIAIIQPGVKIPKNNVGAIQIKAEYIGSKLYNGNSAEVSFIETEISMECVMVDTIKTVKVTAMKINADGTKSFLKGEKIAVSVQRMFSKLPIGEISINDDGTGSVEFPDDLPGDSVGNLEVVAFIADHELYGNIEKKSSVKWGIPKQQVLITHRALWTQIAPIWMIVSLSVLLTGVWAHYLYVIIQLIIVRFKGKQFKLEVKP
jgi:hypothetical protein